jgi:hypothetical protein
MPERAQVTSIDAIEAFRAGVVNYVGKARPVLEDAIDDVLRTRDWLEQDQRAHWENQLKKRRRAVEDAEQAVFSARISNLREVSTAETHALIKARRALAEAEEKLRAVRKWIRDFDNRVGPMVKQLEQVRTMLGNTMPKAVTHLAALVKSLDAYANTSTGTVLETPAVEVPAEAAASAQAAAESPQPEAPKP